MKMMPHIYKDIGDNLPAAIYDKYSGYWLCKYPKGGYLSYHTDADADAGHSHFCWDHTQDDRGAASGAGCLSRQSATAAITEVANAFSAVDQLTD